MKTFGAELNKRIATKGVAVQALAKRIGKSPSYISDLGSGKKVNIPEPRVLRVFESDLDWPMVDQLVAFGYLESGEVGDQNDPPAIRELTMLMRQVNWRPVYQGIARDMLHSFVANDRLLESESVPPDQVELE